MLQTSIQNLYKVFSVYKLNRRIYGCYCNVCLSEEYNQYLHEKPLGELTQDDFIAYLGSCEILAGDQNDFKYFIPRMLELIVVHDGEHFMYDSIFDKIGESSYHLWEYDEVEAVNNFFKQLWHSVLKLKETDKTIDIIYALADASYPVEFCLKNLSAFKPDDLAELLVKLYDSDYLNELSKYSFNSPNEYRVKIKEWFLSSKNRNLLSTYFESGKDLYGRTAFVIEDHIK